MKSNCCNAPMRVSTADEGTSFYVCTKCSRACDERAIMNKQDKEAVKRFREEVGNVGIDMPMSVNISGVPYTGYKCVVCLENAQIILPPTMCQAHYEQWEGAYHGTKTIKQMVKEYKLFQQGEGEGG